MQASPRLGALLRAALADDGEAVASWAMVEVELDLDTVRGDEYDALCLVGSRLARLPVATERARLVGMARHAWTANQASFATTLSAEGTARRVVGGRWATLAHLPSSWVLPAGGGQVAPRWNGPTVDRRLGDFAVRVPSLAAQLVVSLTARRWIDAACLIALDPLPDDVAAEAARIRRLVAVREGLENLTALVGTSIVTADRIPELSVGRLRAARERFWTAAFGAASNAGVRKWVGRSA
jgi:hypothetical protein